MLKDQRTIAAIATPRAAGGIGIVRVSGKDAPAIADKIFKAKSGKLPSQSEGYRAHYGKVFSKERALDEAICLVFRAPHSYTGEDTVEFHCHGGLYITQSVLRAALDAGAFPAAAGEFTKRAYLNGRLSLDRAEAVMSLISAQGEQAAQAALTALEGSLAGEIKTVADELIAAAAKLNAWVDFPDEEIEDTDPERLKAVFKSALDKLQGLLDSYDLGRAVTNGVETAIVGRPNVGKSTLMNLLTGYDKSIVTDYAGTTRDIVEETVNLGPLVLRLADTAGLRPTDDPVEKIGVDRALKRIERSSLILAVFDGSDSLTPEDKALLSKCAGKPTIAVINKTDLDRNLDLDYIRKTIGTLVEISASQGWGVEALTKAVEDLLGTADFDAGAAILANERQRQCVLRAANNLSEALQGLESGMTLDAVAFSNEAAIEALLELSGEKVSDAVVNEIFSNFCVGK
ncbi:MAG: tRNA uridine-5-carboxymethylaminomethyl(34) synthesis GTPase MnmE [Clostridiales bacterium]|nr:tRNA uridine-5-carboxymethylaminomethyl(34) synthesis GTPase MnmE [Clostridiales bacterium]